MIFPLLTTVLVKAVGWQMGFSLLIVPALVLVGGFMMALPEVATVETSGAEPEPAGA
jgi:hypothetical protein